MNLAGTYHIRHIRGGKVLRDFTQKNLVTTQGKNYLLDVNFKNATQASGIYLGLINNSGFSSVNASNTYAGINVSNGWSELTGYEDTDNSSSTTTRPAWYNDLADEGSVNAITYSVFTATSAVTVRGVFLVFGPNSQTQGNNTSSGNILFSAGAFGTNATLAIGDELQVTYSLDT